MNVALVVIVLFFMINLSSFL